MKGVWKIMVNAALILVGSLIFFAVLAAVGFDVNKLSSNPLQTEQQDIAEPFSAIDIGLSCSDVKLDRADGETCRIEYTHVASTAVLCEVKDGTLTVSETKSQRWTDHVGIATMTPSMTVYLPKDTYERLTVILGTGDLTLPSTLSFGDTVLQNGTGDVTCEAAVTGHLEMQNSTGKMTLCGAAPLSLRMEGSTSRITVTDVQVAETLHIQTKTGDITVTDVTAEQMEYHASTGGIMLDRAVAVDTLIAATNTSDITLRSCDAAALQLKAKTGNISGSVATPKQFQGNASTGDVDVPPISLEANGTCVAQTNTGDIHLTEEEASS